MNICMVLPFSFLSLSVVDTWICESKVEEAGKQRFFEEAPSWTSRTYYTFGRRLTSASEHSDFPCFQPGGGASQAGGQGSKSRW